MTSHIRHPYCLYCYAPMEAYLGSRQACERCGHVNVKLDQELYWTREKRFRDLEELVKTCIVIFLVGVALFMLWGVSWRPGIGTGQGWAVGFPIAVGVVLWETASKITRYKPYFRATIVWRIVLLILGLPPTLWGLAFLGEAPLPAMIALAIGLPMLAGALFLGMAGRAFARYREARVLAGQRADA